jgi:peptide deformylase
MEQTTRIRTFGDPVLSSLSLPVTNIDAKLVRLVESMLLTLHSDGSAIGLAAPQVGVNRQVFVWNTTGVPHVILNPEIVESDGEWVFPEGCLSLPGLFVDILRPEHVLMRGVDLDGDSVEIEASALDARLFQHEVDHLNGVLMFDRMQPDQRRDALVEYELLRHRAATRKAATL